MFPGDEAEAQQKWEDMNDAIMGNGVNAITDADYRIDAHVALLSDVDGNLAEEFESSLDDHIHYNNAGREIVAAQWRAALLALGL